MGPVPVVAWVVNFVVSNDPNTVFFENHGLHEELASLVIKGLAQYVKSGFEDFNIVVCTLFDLDPFSGFIAEIIHHKLPLAVGNDFHIAGLEANDCPGNRLAIAVNDLPADQMGATG